MADASLFVDSLYVTLMLKRMLNDDFGPMIIISKPRDDFSKHRPSRCFLTVFLPPFPNVGYPIFLEIRNPWGKVMERSGLRYEHFCLKIV